MVKQCQYCGRYFVPDRRVGSRQRPVAGPNASRSGRSRRNRSGPTRTPGITRVTTDGLNNGGSKTDSFSPDPKTRLPAKPYQ